MGLKDFIKKFISKRAVNPTEDKTKVETLNIKYRQFSLKELENEILNNTSLNEDIRSLIKNIMAEKIHPKEE